MTKENKTFEEEITNLRVKYLNTFAQELAIVVDMAPGGMADLKGLISDIFDSCEQAHKSSMERIREKISQKAIKTNIQFVGYSTTGMQNIASPYVSLQDLNEIIDQEKGGNHD